jgi:hypothetical protein
VRSHFGNWNLNGLSNFQRAIAGVKTHLGTHILAWKTFEEGYNFSLDIISIGGLHTKLWVTKVVGVPTLGILGFPFGSLVTK